ncbi:MAG TPA: NTP transferase domain-containing protein, partial [Rhizobiaceae bacterium]|nr:NTP transferase domain-containing protein [Rhizobiaceae bacterium]
MARMKPLVLIPARMASTRLPGKPLADIAGKPMIVRVAERAVAAGIGPVVVCTDDADIAAAVRAAGIETAMTADTHLSGSDRIFEALTKLDPRGDVPVIVNVQGDLPALDPSAIRTAVKQLDDPSIDIGTIAAQIKREAEKTNPNVVKVVGTPVGPRRLRA